LVTRARPPATGVMGVPPAERVAASTGASPALSLMALNVRVTPAQARVFLDDEELSHDALARVVARDGRVHHLRAEAEGYLPRSEVVIFDGANIAVHLTLDKRPPEAAALPARGRGANAAPPKPLAPPPRTPTTVSGDSAPTPALNPQGGKPPKRAVDPWNPYSGD
jgi:eukaryotic-like serine/threonine-protein kinase